MNTSDWIVRVMHRDMQKSYDYQVGYTDGLERGTKNSEDLYKSGEIHERERMRKIIEEMEYEASANMKWAWVYACQRFLAQLDREDEKDG